MKQIIFLLTSAFSVTLCNPQSAISQWAQTGVGEQILVLEINALAASGGTVFAGTDATIYHSTNNGLTWLADTSGLGGDHGSALLATGGTRIIAGGYHVTPRTSSFFLSSNFGSQWLPMNNGLNDDSDLIQALAMTGNGTIYAGTIGSGIFISTDQGANWTQANNGLTLDSVRAFAVLDTNAANPMVFAGTNNDNRGTGGIFLSTNNGASWTQMSNGLGPTNIHAIVATGGNTSSPILFAGTINSGVYRSTDKGTSWNFSNNGLPIDAPIVAMAVYGSNSPTPYIFGAADGVYLSTNNGASWVSVSDGLTTDPVLSLAVSNSYIFAGTADSGVWACPLSYFGVSAVSTIVPINPSLTNYPNPFSQSTTINFSTPESGLAEVTIVNLLGSEVARVFSGELDAGQHQFSWNAGGMPPGLYECVVHMIGHVEETPLLVIP